jgi:acetyl esterase
LDPDARAFLDLLTSARPQPFAAMSPEEARAFVMSRLSVVGQNPPLVADVKNFSVGPETAIPVRLYRGEGTSADEALPAVVFFHGGGWVVGNLDSHDALCRQIANAGACAVLSVDYRLAPEHKFPAALRDAEQATLWLLEHADELKLDSRCFVLAGDSAGGTLAAVVALQSAQWQRHRIALQILIYPCVDLAADSASYQSVGTGYALTAESMRWFIGQYLQRHDDHMLWQASPMKAPSFKGAPAAVIMTAGYDPLCDEGVAYARRLAADGVAVTHRHFSGQMHGFVTSGKLIPTSQTAVAEIGLAIRSACKYARA